MFAVYKQMITIVNYSDDFAPGHECLLIKLNAKTEHDKIEDVFITYEKAKKRITLHYFEKVFDYRQKFM